MSQTPDPSAPLQRPAEPRDEAFLYDLYAENRAQELAGLAWPEAQRAAFLRMQYDARRRSHASLPLLERLIVELHGIAAGTISISRSDDALHVANIALRPEFRGRGLGTRLLGGVIAEAEASGKSVSLSVEKNNRAERLYQRLGFEETGDDGVYMKLERPHRPTRTASRQGKRGRNSSTQSTGSRTKTT
jgi:ribosomal protein S18 acetylase RimI-like enzyme